MQFSEGGVFCWLGSIRGPWRNCPWVHRHQIREPAPEPRGNSIRKIVGVVGHVACRIGSFPKN